MDLVIYLLKVSACTGLFFALYYFVLSKFTFFYLSRVYLVLMLLLSFCIPLITVEKKLEIGISNIEKPVKTVYADGTLLEKDFIDVDKGNFAVDWLKVPYYAYLLVVALFIIWLFITLVRIKNQLRRFTIGIVDRNVHLVSRSSPIKNCSFLGIIIIDESLDLKQRKLVVKHELVHVQQFHTVDKILAHVVMTVLWFNPFIYFWRNAIDLNHEFLADQGTLKFSDKKDYSSLLLQLAVPLAKPILNSFSKQPLKRRIKMMYKRPSVALSKWIYFSIVPAILICGFTLANRKEVYSIKGFNTSVLPRENKSNVAKLSYFNSNNIVGVKAKAEDIVLIIDAGHGGKDNVAESLDGQKEKDMNLRLAMILREEAIKRGIKVKLTRDNDSFVMLRDRLPTENANAFISVHHNAGSSNTALFPGIEVYVSKLNKRLESVENLGTNLLTALQNAKGIKVRDSLKNANLLLLRESKVPSVLIEFGNISNRKSLDFINKEKNIRQLCNLILDGFVSFSKTEC